MESNVNERIIRLIEMVAEGSEKKFALALGVKPAVINHYTTGKQKSKPGFEMLHRIAEVYPFVSLEWLISGKGATLKTDSLMREPMPEKIVVSVQDTSRNVSIPLINQKAAANYVTGYQSQEYFEELDMVALPSALVKGQTWYALHVAGNSMQPTLHEGDLVICNLYEQAAWQQVHDNEVCVVVSASGGLQLKRIKNRLHDGYLLCQSDNREHPTFKLPADDLLQLWKVSWRLSARLEDQQQMVYDRLRDIEDRLEKIEGRY